MATVNGTKGDDTIFIDAGNDVVKAGDGNDTIWAGSGDDTITGGKGNNTIKFNPLPIPGFSASFGHDIINLTGGENLTLDCSSKNDFKADIVGKDVVVTFGNEEESITLKNFASKDVVSSNGSVNLKIANPNSENEEDTYLTIDLKTHLYDGGTFSSKGVYSGKWLSEIINGSYLDERETGFGKNGTDGVTVNAGAGHDEITGSKFADKIIGGDGNDTIKGGRGNDTITGGSGANVIIHNTGDDNDIVNLSKGENLTLQVDSFTHAEISADKKDVLVYNSENEYITLKNLASKDVTNNKTKKTDDTSSIVLENNSENIDLRTYLYEVSTQKNYTGTWLNEHIDASSYVAKDKNGVEIVNNTKGLSLNGGKGDDVIDGSMYADTIKGGEGADAIYGGNGNDTIYGENGNDYIEGGIGTDTIYGGDGDDKIVASEYLGSTKPADVNTVTDYYSHFLADTNAKTIDGGKGNDVIWGSAGADKINGGAGNDKIYAFGENSVINGGDGNDLINLYQDTAKTVYGGNGDDTISIECGKATVDTGAGNDTIWGGYISESDIIFKKGSGHDLYKYRGALKEGSAGDNLVSADTLIFDNISVTSLSFNKDGNNLVINYGKNDSVTVENYYKSDSYLVESDKWEVYIQTKDGGKVLLSQLVEAYKEGYIGTSKADYINGNDGDNLIYGFAGNDYIEGGIGADTIYGGDGDDKIVASKYLGSTKPAGVNTVTDYYSHFLADTNAKTIDGGKGNDVIWGSAGADKINGGAGNDKIYAFGENSVINGGDGNDLINLYQDTAKTVYGGNGNDTISIEYGKATVDAGAGNDTIWGGYISESDIIFKKGDGSDLYKYRGALKESSAGDNQVNEETLVFEDSSITDLSFARKGDNLVITYGKNSNVTIENYYKFLGATEPEQLEFVYGNGNIAHYITGSENWLINIQTKDGDKILLSELLGFYEKGYIGTANDDVINGNDGDNLIYGFAGDDYIEGGAGADTIYGGAGYDVIDGGDGNDFIDGQEGESYLMGGAGDDQIIGGSGYDVIDGGDGNDFIDGREGQSYLMGGAGDDQIIGGDDADCIEGGEGKDSIYGGNGNDTIFASTYLGSTKPAGVNTVTDYYSHFLADTNAKTIDGGKGNDVIWGSAGADKINGGAGNDKIYAFGENSVINGGDGNDLINLYQDTAKTVYGGNGDDTISIECGKATVDTGAGNDTIWGGYISESTFIFAEGDGNDTYQYRGYTTSGGSGTPTYCSDTLVFENVSIDDMIFAKDGENLVINYAENSSVALERFFKDDVDAANWNVYIQTEEGNTLISEVVDINAIKEGVSGWLSSNGYSDVETGLANATDEQVANLVAIFENANVQLTV